MRHTTGDNTMTDAPDNPAAFPLPCFEQNGKFFYQDGMTLRDWFAGQALVGLLSGRSAIFTDQGEVMAEHAYSHADAMIAARKAKP